MRIFYIAWSDREAKKWYPVGRLCYDKKKYIFCYTRGAEESPRFAPFGSMLDFSKVYTSDDLFPLFENRILNKNRPEFNTLLEWLDLDEDKYDPLDVLALTEGKRGTDSLEIFPCPTITKDNVYKMSFFSHGLRYIDDWSAANLKKLKAGDQLYMCPDPQNRYDPNAIILRSDDPISFVGYCPRYLTKDFMHLLKKTEPLLINLQVQRINPDAPMMYRVMCTIKAPCPDGFVPCSHDHFKPIPQSVTDHCSFSGKKACKHRDVV
jgi:HIRAN domain.